MFLQIDLHEDDRFFQSILWRESVNDPLLVYLLNTVTFGLAPSPFLAIRTLRKHAQDHGEKYPEAAKILLNSTFVDDILGGAETEEDAREIILALIALLALGDFHPRKWTSSHPSILEGFHASELEIPCLDDPNNPRFSILGMLWLAVKDAFTFNTEFSAPAKTKRGILSAIATLFDPLGLIAPVVLKCKAFMQELWRSHYDWDETLPSEIVEKWSRFQRSMPALKELIIPRLLHRKGSSHFQIHGFCDSSEIGYSAALYLRSALENETAHVSIIIAKTRVAPLKKVKLPRLELCAATLLAELLNAYLPQLETYYKIEKVFCWSDSTTVLSWIRLPTYRLQTFVANRVTIIQSLRSDVVWRHVRSEDNCADPASRGLTPDELLN
ncbi:uncharacterized protein LOC106779051, partial [Vigna radiata var. radiata]|uniref:Uncharacterized protein LOC106779051 n=1 Tax=Vigna radiata var. radiata TaxID=3916 RepID=A0A1S3VWK3_VIGRR